MENPQLYFVSGVSGVGKSSTMQHLREMLPADTYDIRDFDERGVPDGGGREWHDAETRHWFEAALRKLTEDYSMTWMYRGKHVLFPKVMGNMVNELQKVYSIQGRKYEIKYIAEGTDVVMVELVESYPDTETGQVYRTPLILVLEMQDGKIRTGQHYCDPQISYEHLDAEVVEAAYRSAPTKFVVE